MKLYGVDKSNEEIKQFVYDYVDSCKKSRNDRFLPILSLFKRNEQDNATVLDYGCGWGHYSVALKEMGFNVTGIDLSQNEVDICNLAWGEGKKDLIFEKKTIAQLDSSTFDYVLSSQVIEHVHNVGNYLSEINRVLKIGGHLVIALPNIMTPRFFVGNMSKNLNKSLIKTSHEINANYDKAHHHINAWDPAHLVRLVSTVGFLLEEYIPTEGVPVPYPLSKILRQYLYFKNRRLKNLSYTMAFRFRKVAEKKVQAND